MHSRRFILTGFAAVLCLLACRDPALAQDGLIHPSTRGAYQTLRLLKQAMVADRMNAHAWTSDNPTLDAYYADKAREVQSLIERLETKQQPVSSLEVQRALDTRGARVLSGEYWDVRDAPTHY